MSLSSVNLQLLSTVRVPGESILCCDISHDGRYVAFGDAYKRARVIDLEASLVRSTADGEHKVSHQQQDIRFMTKSANFVASFLTWCDCALLAYKCTQKLGGFLEHHAKIQFDDKKEVRYLDFHLQRSLICQSYEDCFCVWDHQNQEKGFRSALVISGKDVKQVRFQPKLGNYLAVVDDCKTYLYKVTENAVIRKAAKTFTGYDASIRSLCWDSTGTYIATLCCEGACIFSVDRNIRLMLDARRREMISCTFYPNKSNVLVIGGYKEILLWDSSDDSLHVVEGAHDKTVDAMASVKDMIVSAGDDGKLIVWKCDSDLTMTMKFIVTGNSLFQVAATTTTATTSSTTTTTTNSGSTTTTIITTTTSTTDPDRAPKRRRLTSIDPTPINV